jgi:hypothetical protein
VDSAGSFAPAPQWLLDRISGNGNDTSNSNGAAPVSTWRARISADVGEGQRNDTIARIAGHLLRQYVDAHIVHELLQSWNATHCRPPLDDVEVERIVDSICGRELKRRGV